MQYRGSRRGCFFTATWGREASGKRRAVPPEPAREDGRPAASHPAPRDGRPAGWPDDRSGPRHHGHPLRRVHAPPPPRPPRWRRPPLPSLRSPRNPPPWPCGARVLCCCWGRAAGAASSDVGAGAGWPERYGWASTTGTRRRMMRSMSFRYARSSVSQKERAMPAGARAARAADAVDVGLGHVGQVVVDDVRDAVDVDAARGDVGGHQHPASRRS